MHRHRSDRPTLVRTFALSALAAVLGMSACLWLAVPALHLVGDSVHLANTLGDLRALSQRSTIYAADGTTTLGVLGTTDRQDVPLRDVPRVLIDAVVDTEDATFWTNPGVDLAAMARSLATNIESGHIEEGGSTITQQLVKNRLLDARRDLHRKLSEMSLAIQLDSRYSKRRILQEYLNTVYFGQGAYGVKVAAERLFVTTDPATGAIRGKHLDELTLPDAALLAGLISSPEGANPFVAPDRARARRAVALQRMVERGTITAAAAQAADRAPLPSRAPPGDLRPHDYFVDEVQQTLLADPRLGPTEAERRRLLLSGGLKIVSTLDPVAQAQAHAAVDAVLPNQPPFTVALAAMDPATGAVRAMVGGPGYEQLQYNLVTHLPGRQAGSTYKVITLAAALEAGYSPNDDVDGTSPCVAVRPPLEPWATVNAEPGQGVMSLRDATAESVNCAYAHVIASLGPAAVVDMAHRLGIVQDVPAYLSITLGTKETTPLEMTTVASTLAAGGVRRDPHFVTKVTTPDGRVLVDDSQPAGKRVVDQDVVDCETDVLRGVVTGGTGTAAGVSGHDVAGKTGTTDEKADAWFLGYTPQLAAVVWMGATTGAVPMTDVGGIEVYGGTYPARIWQAFAAAALADLPNASFPAAGPVCDRPGAFISDGGRGQAAPPSDQFDGGEPSSPLPPPAASPTPAPASPQPAPTAPQPAPTSAPAPAPASPPPGNGHGHGR